MRGMRALGSGLAIVLLLVLVVGGTVLGAAKDAPGSAAAVPAAGKGKGDSAPAHNFKIEIDGVISGGFKEITGLESEVEVIEYRSGDDALTRKRPGAVKYQNVIIKVDATDPVAKALAEWYQQVASGKDIRKQISIIVYDRDNKEVARYNLFEAWPCRWKAPELNSHSDSYAVEEIEFVVERVERG